MTERKLTAAEENVLWDEAARRLSLIDLEPPIGMERVDQLLQQLPARQPGETLGELLRRASHTQGAGQQPFAIIQLDSESGGKILIEDRRENRKRLLRFVMGVIGEVHAERFTPVTEIVRLAAADLGEEIALPDPGRALESPDGRFRIRLRAEAGKIEVAVQALGFAVDEFARQRIGLVAPTDKADEDSDTD